MCLDVRASVTFPVALDFSGEEAGCGRDISGMEVRRVTTPPGSLQAQNLIPQGVPCREGGQGCGKLSSY